MKLCDYGCGQEAKYRFKNGKWCCEEHWSRCPAKINNLISYHIGKKRTKIMIQNMVNGHKKRSELLKKEKEEKMVYQISMIGIEPCFYCRGISKYFFKAVEKYCCEDHYLKCPAVRKNQGKKTFAQLLDNNNNDLCSYGCGQKAKYIFLNGSYCCSERLQSCPEIRKKNAISNSIKQKGKSNGMYGKTQSRESNRKNRLSNIKDRENKFGKCSPNYNKKACKIIEEYGKQHGYNFQHAENGGEFFIEKLGYWVDGYDKKNNIVLEIDEAHHFDAYGNLIVKDIIRQKEIKDYLNCKFIRIKNL